MQAVLIENPKAGRASTGSLRVTERALEATFELELVTTNARGHAAALAREAVESGAKTVDLTSRPSREAANRLYQKIGFVPRETNVYRFDLGG